MRTEAPTSRHHWRRDRAVAAVRVALFPSLLLAWSCSAAPQRAELLGQAVRSYNDGVRWQRFDRAASHLPPSARDDFLELRDRLNDDLRISDYQVIRTRYDSKRRRARVQVKTTWHRDSRGIVHETHTVQSWQRRGQRWLMIGERHLRGEPLPGVEPDASSADEATEPADDPGRGEAGEPGAAEDDDRGAATDSPVGDSGPPFRSPDALREEAK